LKRNGCVTAGRRSNNATALSIRCRKLISGNRKRRIAHEACSLAVESTGVRAGQIGLRGLHGCRGLRGILCDDVKRQN
jgi:hypothetical protein